MKQVDVRFDSGQQVLNAYWGFLADGGLIIPDGDGLHEGQPIELTVYIDSLSADYKLGATVVRRDVADQQAIVAFVPGEPHDMLLTAALSETDDVPPRRYQRLSVALPVEVCASDGDHAGRLLDLSVGGCCVRLSQCNGCPAVGSSVTIATQAFSAAGCVVWVRGSDHGVCFDSAGTWAASHYIDSL